MMRLLLVQLLFLAFFACFPVGAARFPFCTDKYCHYSSSIWTSPNLNWTYYDCMVRKGFVSHLSLENFFVLPPNNTAIPLISQQGELDFEGRTLAPWSKWTAAVKEKYPHMHMGAMVGPVLTQGDQRVYEQISNLLNNGDAAIDAIVKEVIAGRLDSVDVDIESHMYLDELADWVMRLAKAMPPGVDVTSTTCFGGFGSCTTMLNGGVTSVVLMDYSNTFEMFRDRAESFFEDANPDNQTTGPLASGPGVATWWRHLNQSAYTAVSAWFGSQPPQQRHWWHWGLDVDCCSRDIQKALYRARFGKEASEFCSKGEALSEAVHI